MKRFLKRFEFHLEILQTWKLYATQWVSWEKIKWLLQNARKESSKFQRNQIESPFVVVLKPTFNLELFGFISKIKSPKIKYKENRVKWFPTVEKWRKMSLKSFWYFKIILFGF